MKCYALIGCGAALLALAAIGATSSPQPQPQPEQQVDVVEALTGLNSLVAKGLHQVRGPRDDDPLRYLRDDMNGIVGDLSQYQTNQPVQKKQAAVVSEMDILIKMLEKSCNGNGGGSLNPTRPMSDSRLGGGPGGVNDLQDPKA